MFYWFVPANGEAILLQAMRMTVKILMRDLRLRFSPFALWDGFRMPPLVDPLKDGRRSARSDLTGGFSGPVRMRTRARTIWGEFSIFEH